MTNRRCFRYLVSGVAVLVLMAGSALASTFKVPYPGTMGGTRIEAGRYKITWQEHSPDVTVSVTQGKKTVATVKGRLESRNMKFQRNMVVYNTNADGSQTISELRFGGTNTAIVFSE